MDLFTQPETAEATRLSERTLERHRLTGTGPQFVRLGRRVFYRREDVEEWIAANVCSSTSQADAMAGHCCGTNDDVVDELKHAAEENPAGVSPGRQKPRRAHPPLAGQGTPIESEPYHARSKMAQKSSAREGAVLPRDEGSGKTRCCRTPPHGTSAAAVSPRLQRRITPVQIAGNR